MDNKRINCKYWSGGICSLGYGAESSKPTAHECSYCWKRVEIRVESESVGLGDTVKKFIDKVSLRRIKQCGGCKKRQQALNKLMPYGDKIDGN